MFKKRYSFGIPSTANVITSKIEINAVNKNTRKKPRFCLVLSDSLNFVRIHIKLNTNISIIVNTKKYLSIKTSFILNQIIIL